MNGLTTTKSLIKGLLRYVALVCTVAAVFVSDSLRALVQKSKRQTLIRTFDILLQSDTTPIIPIISAAGLFNLLAQKGYSSSAKGLDIQMGERTHGDLSIYETFLLTSIVRSIAPKALFEFGTFKGRTTHHLAANAPTDAKIWTLDLPAEAAPLNADMDNYDAWLIRQKGITGEMWLNDPLAQRDKITQLWGDSKVFDYSPFQNKMDFVFIDANHTYSYVRSDTENALAMIKPTGIIVWDNFDRYRNNRFHSTVNRWYSKDLNHYLFELQRRQPLFQIADTGFVVMLVRTTEPAS